ncbi:DUF6263 family protein [Planctomicrobium sp. SH661]|uniref:DUF6263 family protein n=1 Tax=Planctomicrobium sp. SH661 TaxID=3448124 RepID=UPI003F5B41F1
MSTCKRHSGTVFLTGILCLFLYACNSQKKSDKADVELPAWLTEEGARNRAAEETRAASESPSAELGLNLNPGDQFPLRKVVQQELIQGTPSGEPVKNYSRLELMMAISVQEKREKRTKLSVRYHRVKYQHEVADERVEFDSTVPSQSAPLGVIAYRDMVNDGFAFWVGEDNQIVEVEGLSEFVDRCLRNVPPQHRQEVMLGIEAGSGESGIANFVDNTIGLLPYGRRTTPGDSWERQQQISRPIPMHVSNMYTLKDLSDSLAVIDVRGTITPSTTLHSPDGGESVKVTVNGGSTLGSCTIYRDTGLPKESRVDRIVDMTVVMQNSLSFRQTKRITTTVESFPATTVRPEAEVAQPAIRPVIRQVSGEYAQPR